MFNYENWLTNLMYKVANELNLNGYNFEVYNEQSFVKKKDVTPKTIYVILKYLSSSKIESTQLQPIQALIMSEENGLQIASLIFTKIALDYNLYAMANIELGGGNSKDMLKMTYTSPVVLSNFNMVGHGYRSVLYSSINLYVLLNVVDVEDLKINGESISYTTCSTAYTMTADVQDFNTSNFVKSVKSKQSFAMTIALSPTTSQFFTKITQILNDEISGDEQFGVTFMLNGVKIIKQMKISTININSTKMDAPTIVVGLTE